ncbi:MAG: GAF domain-containing sensor histidine kinase [Anaerolinea sp.]|nr:GAF domain-containing sensor histidine kinase [Anaerolinea sp.]
MNTEYSDYTRRLERLLEVCRILSANLEIEPLLQSIIEMASELTNSNASYILIYDEEGACLRHIAGPWYQLEMLQTLAVPLERSILGWVYSHNEPRVVQAGEDHRLYTALKRELGGETVSLLAVPMIFRGTTIGVFAAANKARDYTEEDLTILETLASQAVIAIRNEKWLGQAQAAYEKAMELDRMKRDFIAIVSHELRTPLGVVLGHASLLAETCAPEEKADLDTIVRNALRLREIIQDFADLDKFERGFGKLDLKPVDMSQLVRQTAALFSDLAKDHQVEMLVQAPKTRLMLEGDAEKIAIALRNLIKNAITFTDPGGRVVIGVEAIPGYIKVTVLDTGIGIPQEEQQKIFERFYQVEKHMTRRHGGLGVGLSIAKELIELHGGRIWVESEEGVGSRFLFALPLNRAQAAAAGQVFQTKPAKPGQ